MTDQDHDQKSDSDEIYEEPPRVVTRDVMKIVTAIVALVIIGIAGYIWLTPGLGFESLISGKTTLTQPVARGNDHATAMTNTMAEEPQTIEPAVVAETPEVVEKPPVAEHDAAALADPLAAPHTHEPDQHCAFCGMLANRSLSPVVVKWADGSHTHHDCWDCVVNYQREQGLTLAAAVVLDFGTEDDPVWLAHDGAWYLYDTISIKGSMPPYVAAFATRAAAQAAQPELGGEIVDFTGLRAKWES